MGINQLECFQGVESTGESGKFSGGRLKNFYFNAYLKKIRGKKHKLEEKKLLNLIIQVQQLITFGDFLSCLYF